MRVLVVYGSTEGHTRTIALRIAEVAEREGHKVEVLNSASLGAPQDPYWFDAVILGGSVHQGRHQSSLREFMLSNKALLERLPSAFFSVSLSAAVRDDLHQEEALGYLTTFLEETAWRPQATATFAGAVRHAEYDYFKKLVLKMLAGQLGPGVIKGEDVIYTDWAAVERFAKDFLELAQTLEKPFADEHKT